MAAARAKMIARRFGGKDVSKTGGKGSDLGVPRCGGAFTPSTRVASL